VARRSLGSFQHVLCPIDFSKHSRTALQYGAAVADRTGGRLHVLFVNDPLLVAAAASAYDERTLARTSAAELRNFIERAIGDRKVGSGRVEAGVAMGDPSTEIGREASRLGADLIALGTEGLSGASKLFFGSTTSRVLRNARVPVLAVPPAAPKVNPRTWPGKQLIAAIQLGPDAAKDVRAAAKAAAAFGASLQLMHVVEPLSIPRWLGPAIPDVRDARVAGARRQLEKLARGVRGDTPVEVRVMFGKPDEQISAAAASAGAGLVVVTLRPGGLFGPAQGAITYRVVSVTNRPVLALPSR
jgi:nucleotide-binding universal stress UspA family protein